MPRYIIDNASSKSPHHDKLVKRLAQELQAPGADLQPLILEEKVEATGSQHVHVIWDGWKGLADDERSRIVIAAYEKAEGTQSAEKITIAAGVTPDEAVALGLLPWKVAPLRKRHEAKPTMAEHNRVWTAEARHTLLGPEAKELRYTRPEDAEDARRRLEKALPGSQWMVEREVQFE